MVALRAKRVSTTANKQSVIRLFRLFRFLPFSSFFFFFFHRSEYFYDYASLNLLAGTEHSQVRKISKEIMQDK